MHRVQGFLGFGLKIGFVGFVRVVGFMGLWWLWSCKVQGLWFVRSWVSKVNGALRHRVFRFGFIGCFA